MKFVVYTESQPRLKKDALSGLDILLEPICSGLQSSFESLVYNNVYGQRRSKIPEFFENKINEINNDKIKLNIFEKILPVLTTEERQVIARSNKINHLSSQDELLIIVGADIRIVSRSFALAKITQKKYSIYFIDDPMASLENKKLARLRKFIWERFYRRFIRNAKSVFSFTEIHADKISKKYGVSCIELPLPYYSQTLDVDVKVVSNDIKSEETAQRKLLYVGSVNYLYEKNLIDLIKIINQINRKKNQKIILQLTNDIQVDTQEGFFVERIDGELLQQAIADSDACILSYSFNPAHREIVENTFPSKIFQYLPYAQKILFIGPDYGELPKLAKISGGYIEHINNDSELSLSLEKADFKHKDNIKSLKFIDEFISKYSIANFGKTLKYFNSNRIKT